VILTLAMLLRILFKCTCELRFNGHNCRTIYCKRFCWVDDLKQILTTGTFRLEKLIFPGVTVTGRVK